MGKNPAQKAKAKATTKSPKKTAAKKKAKPKSKKVAKKAGAPEKATGRCCKIKSCKRAYRAKGYCSAHYKKWRNGEYGKARFKCCSKTECRKPKAVNRHGYCEEHYQSYFVKKVAPTAPAAEQAPKAEEAANEQGAA